MTPNVRRLVTLFCAVWTANNWVLIHLMVPVLMWCTFWQTQYLGRK